MFSDALCLGHGTATDADRRRGPTPRQGCSLHRLGRSAPSCVGRSALPISLFHRHCRTTPGRCLRTGQSRRDNRRRASHARKGHHHWTLVAEQLLHRVTDQGYADSAGPADLHREVVPDSKVIPVNVKRLTMLPAHDNHDAAPPSCHRRVVHNQEPPLPGKGNEGS